LPRTAREVKEFLVRLGLRPRKRFGQNFMVDPNLLDYLVRAAEVSPGDHVLEIGTGTGLLTAELLETGADVVTVEADTELFRAVDGRFPDGASLRRIHGDALAGKRRLAPAVEAAIAAWAREGFLVVANLPYNVSVPILMNLLAVPTPPRRMVVTVQKEVADRLLAAPDTAAYGRVTVEIRLQAEVTRLRNLGPGVFWPRPEVDSSAIRIVPRRTWVSPGGVEGPVPSDAEGPVPSDAEGFRRFLDAVFGQRRKRMAKVLEDAWPGATARLAAAGIAPDARAEQLSPETLLRLFEVVAGGCA
jgi:16S rRNA (adenine1518-N6/adenine1519-N6)-dimethyltransferase